MEVLYSELFVIFDCECMRTLRNNLLGKYTELNKESCLIINQQVADIVTRAKKEGTLNISSAANLLGVSEDFMRTVCAQNKLTYYGIGGNKNPKILFFKSTFLREIQGVKNVFQVNSHNTLSQYNSLIASIDYYIKEYEMLDKRSIDMLVSYNNGQSLGELGLRYKISRERARQIVEKARNKRSHLVGDALRNYLKSSDEFFYVYNLENELESLKRQLIIAEVDPKDNISIADCDFSVRLYNCLSAAQLKTIGDIKRYNGNFLKFRNMGKKSLDELRDYMKHNHRVII